MPPIKDEWRSHFPVGVYISTEDAQQRAAGNTTATIQCNPNGVTHWPRLLNHPEQGLRPNGMNYSFPAAAQVYNWEDVQGISAYLDTTVPMHKTYMGIGGRTHPTDNNTGIDGDWYQRDPANQTYADALAFAAPIVANFQDHPSILGYHFGDDIQIALRGQATATLSRAIQDLDPYGRPVINTTAFPDWWALPDAQYLKLACWYRYPIGKTTGGVTSLEGDFHRETMDFAGGDTDWVDAARYFVARLPASCEGRFHVILQNHSRGDGSLRYPTAREIRKQFWLAIGEGAKGIWMFTWDGSLDSDVSPTGNSWGIGDIHEVSKLQVYGECSQRLKPEIRRALLDCNRVTDKFTTSGGGSTGYPVNYANAYVSTLYDAKRDLYYCVVCNNSLSQANVTISSATLTGKLINLETNAEMRLPVTAALPALDGTIFRYDPDYGVPHTDPDLGVDVQTWWTSHWANPAGANYRNAAAITTHPRVVDVPSGADLQTLINSGPDFTTYRLAAGGVYNGTVEIVGKNGIHIVSANPANKATVRRIHIYGHTRALNYDSPGGMVSQLNTFTPAAINDFYNPGRDFILRDLNFVTDGQLVIYSWYNFPGITGPGPCPDWKHDHRADNIPIWLRNLRDVIVEGCTFTGYDTSVDPRCPADTGGIQDAPSTTGLRTSFHAGILSGNMGMTNIIFRNNVCDVTASGARGWPVGFFVDGGRGCMCISNNFIGKYTSMTLFLTNDDFTQNYYRDGDGGQGLRLDRDSRNARYNVVYDNDYEGGDAITAMTAFGNLVKNNRVSTSVNTMVRVVGRCSRQNYIGHRYIHYGNVIDGNTVTGNVIGAGVEVDSSGCINCSPDQPETYPYRGRVGKTIVTNNHVGGTLTGGANTWLRLEAGDTIPMDGPDVITGNTP